MLIEHQTEEIHRRESHRVDQYAAHSPLLRKSRAQGLLSFPSCIDEKQDLLPMIHGTLQIERILRVLNVDPGKLILSG